LAEREGKKKHIFRSQVEGLDHLNTFSRDENAWPVSTLEERELQIISMSHKAWYYDKCETRWQGNGVFVGKVIAALEKHSEWRACLAMPDVDAKFSLTKVSSIKSTIYKILSWEECFNLTKKSNVTSLKIYERFDIGNFLYNDQW